MKIHFYLRFHTKFGQSLFVSGDIDVLGNNELNAAFPLSYLNDEYWQGTIELDDKNVIDAINYKYIFRDVDGKIITDGEDARNINLSNVSSRDIYLLDLWNYSGDFSNVFYTQPFQNVLLNSETKISKFKSPKSYTHQFKIKAPLLEKDEWVCITGSGDTFKNWDVTKLIPLKREEEWLSVNIDLSNEPLPLTYKYGIYNNKEKLFIYEDGENRNLNGDDIQNKLTVIHDGFIRIQRTWKGAGIAIPVFSLRSKKSFGVGEFSDIKLLIDWAKQAGLKLVQLLPVNDTIATHTWVDSYPYAAISAFALHPVYINLEKIAGSQNASLIKSLNKKRTQLNELAALDFEEVIKFKLSALNELYLSKKEIFKDDTDYFEFFDLNRHWLVPYAVFSFLRDKYKTSDFTKWDSHNIYDEAAVQKLASPSQKYYDKIAVHYFIQYHLHLQMKEATDYAHKNNIILKGDIPIGIYRYGCDAWMNPSLYNMEEQAGAPPDDFAVKGQNWGFPTYNWKKMQEDGFAWWRSRFEQISNYFDAFRIDHILGFFRIWSIPLNAVEGILGRFVPAIPVNIDEFYSNGIWFDYSRYCKPFINETILLETFGDDAGYVKETFLYSLPHRIYQLKEDFNTQRKVENYFQKNSTDHSDKIKNGLFDLISNVILIEEKNSGGQLFHFRIAMEQTRSYKNLDGHTQSQLRELYVNYFYRRQDDFWRKEAMQKLPALKRSTNMLVCGEDLGMVPASVPDVMKILAILSLEIQRMPKDPAIEFFHPRNAPYLSVVTPSTHDMSTIRGWWEEDRGKTQRFYNYIMGHYGQAPFFCEPSINKEIIIQHLYSPAMWSIFQIQDILGMSEKLRRENPNEERINDPANPRHYWRYRMHINLEDLIKEKEFTQDLKTKVKNSSR